MFQRLPQLLRDTEGQMGLVQHPCGNPRNTWVTSAEEQLLCLADICRLACSVMYTYRTETLKHYQHKPGAGADPNKSSPCLGDP